MDITGKIGTFNILRKIGSGGFGTVYLAEDMIISTKDNPVYRAIKIPHRIGVEEDIILRESLVQEKLSGHPNIVHLKSVEKIEGKYILVMEYIKGKDLEEIINDEGKLEIEVAMKYFKELLSAVSFAHRQGVIHRDLRPSNILIDSYDKIKVTDFGTSKLLGKDNYATTRIGSPPYMAPEHFEGRAVYASDIYSCGVIFYEMLTGLPPIVSASPMEIIKKVKNGEVEPLIRKVPKINRELNRIIMKALSPNLSSRYRSVEELLYDLRKYKDIKENDKINEVLKIRERIKARTQSRAVICWNCKKSIPDTSSICPYCHKEQI